MSSHPSTEGWAQTGCILHVQDLLPNTVVSCTGILCPSLHPVAPSSPFLGSIPQPVGGRLRWALTQRLRVPSGGCTNVCRRRYVCLRLYIGMWEQVHSSQIIEPGSSCPRNPIQVSIPG